MFVPRQVLLDDYVQEFIVFGLIYIEALFSNVIREWTTLKRLSNVKNYEVGFVNVNT